MQSIAQSTAILLAAVSGSIAPLAAQDPPPKPQKRLARVIESDPTAPLRLARIDGKYAMLLCQIRVDEPGRELILDDGFRRERSYRGHDDLPDGHWVYVRPYWFIWRDVTARRPAPRAWGPEQATGKPDTDAAGDRDTAWATKAENAAETEWLLLEYDEPLKATAVRIHETFNPGAVSKISIFKHDGDELVVWEARTVDATATPTRVLNVPLPLGFTTERVKVYLETSKVPGWNEIDAVGVVDDKGRTHWAAAAAASTTYATDRSRAGPAEIARPIEVHGGAFRGSRVEPLLVAPEAASGIAGPAEPLVDGVISALQQRIVDELVRKLAAAETDRPELERRVAILERQAAELRAELLALQKEMRALRERKQSP